MEETSANSKESSHSAHANGMNEHVYDVFHILLLFCQAADSVACMYVGQHVLSVQCVHFVSVVLSLCQVILSEEKCLHLLINMHWSHFTISLL